MAINLNGPLVLMRLVLPSFIERRRGCVINIASKAGTLNFPFNISYCTSKAALIRLTGAIQAEVDEVVPSSDIHLYAIHPGAVRSGMSTAGQLTQCSHQILYTMQMLTMCANRWPAGRHTWRVSSCYYPLRRVEEEVHRLTALGRHVVCGSCNGHCKRCAEGQIL
jgi:short-subunit dehydrogenase